MLIAVVLHAMHAQIVSQLVMLLLQRAELVLHGALAEDEERVGGYASVLLRRDVNARHATLARRQQRQRVYPAARHVMTVQRRVAVGGHAVRLVVRAEAVEEEYGVSVGADGLP